LFILSGTNFRVTLILLRGERHREYKENLNEEIILCLRDNYMKTSECYREVLSC